MHQEKNLPILFIHIPKTGGNSLKKRSFSRDVNILDINRLHKLKIINQIKNILLRLHEIHTTELLTIVSAFHYLKVGGQQVTLDLRMQRQLEKYA